MDLSSFIDIEFGDEEGFREFLDLNAITHETLFTTLLSSGTVISHLPMFTFGGEEGEQRDWLLVHDIEHRAMAAAFGVNAPPDLATVNFRDAGQYQTWLSDHAGHHTLLAQAAGL